MGGEWDRVPIGTVAEVFDGPHATPVLTPSGAIFLGIDSLANGRLDLSQTKHISEEDFKAWTRRVHPQAGDVVFSYETRIGQAAIIPDGLRCCLGRRLALIRVKRESVDSRFFLYQYLSPSFQDFLRSRTVPGSTVDRLHLRDVPSFSISLPPLTEQQAIGELLGTLDDRIELNRRIAGTLEAMARTLFKSWFVNFEPVRAKAESRPVGLPEDLAALFPASIAANGLPEGWRMEPLLDHATLLSGGTPKTDKSDYWDGPIAWASAKDVSQCRDAFLVSTERTISEVGLANSAAKIVPAYSTVLVARGATTGRFCMFGRDIAMNQTCYGLSSNNAAPFWLNCAFDSIVDSLTQAGHGSVFNTITTETLRTVRIPNAPCEVIERFEAIASPLFRRALGAIESSRALAEMRDALLPRLMSGELRLRDADRVVAAA